MRTTETRLKIEGLNVHYGQAHALQDVSLDLGDGVLAVVGRNGMGKSTLCKAVTGMVPASGSVRFNGHELIGLAPHDITHLGVAYVPQGRRVWRSLTVDETLKLASGTALQGAWTVERVYQAFPRLAERRSNGGAQLSGGEQQMLAIGRALLFNPQLLVMDEPTEGLAPVIVEQVASLLKRLADERSMSVLLIEQNLGVALEVADRVAVMVNGRISITLPAAELAADRALQQRLLGVSSGSADASPLAGDSLPNTDAHKVMTLVRQHGGSATPAVHAMPWRPRDTGDAPLTASAGRAAIRSLSSFEVISDRGHDKSMAFNRFGAAGSVAYVVGTFDTKAQELGFLRQCIEHAGVRVVTVDLSTSGKRSGIGATVNLTAADVAQYHPQGASVVFGNDRNESVKAMAEAFTHFLRTRNDLGGIASVSGAWGAALVLKGMQSVPPGLPKVIVCTGGLVDTSAFAGVNDICLMHLGIEPQPDSPSHVRGQPGINEQVLANAAHALVGMMKSSTRTSAPENQRTNSRTSPANLTS
jgi:ABC-type branched-subunit amino acid transport system ATPase component